MRQPFDQSFEGRRHGSKFLQVAFRQLGQHSLAFRREMKPYLATILIRDRARDQIGERQTVDEFCGAVRPQKKTFGEVADGDNAGEALRLDSQKSLMLL